MESKWRKAKKALALSLCVHVPANHDEVSPSDDFLTVISSSANSPAASASDVRTVTASSQISRSWSKSFKKTCAICLGNMKPGQGHALFTAECSHTFHFNCITSNVKHGNYICPVCRAKWQEIPFQGPSPTDLLYGRNRINPVSWPHDDPIMTILRRNSPRPDYSPNRPHHYRNVRQSREPIIFNDDEALDLPSETSFNPSQVCIQTVEIKTYPEFSAVEMWASEHNFTTLIHLKAPTTSRAQIPTTSQSSRAPIDLVTVLDISGSMSGTKLALLKRAMSFVIQNLSSSDRLSVITFSTFAHRLFHLRHMSESGRQHALTAVNSLSCNGGTNISEGLRKGVKVIQERKDKNPVCSIILLSDGQDTQSSFPGYSPSTQQSYCRPNLPSSSSPIPVHAFGFGDDHDSVSMHSISENSGGTFSYIEAESVIQDAFAQCIGGLLSVVVQEMEVNMEAMHLGVHINSIQSGSYACKVSEDKRTGSIRVGDLYAEEERDFLVSIRVPPSNEDTNLLRVSCVYRDPVSKEIVRSQNNDVRIKRPGSMVEKTVSIEVDRQRSRLQVAESMAEARAAADRGALQEAATILENRRRILSESEAGRAGDRLCLSLDAELLEIQERMSSQHQYDISGRAYVLSGLSSHSWQRATARGDSTHSTSLVQAYQTPSMVDMLQRSQTLGPPPRRAVSQELHAARSFNLRSQPR